MTTEADGWPRTERGWPTITSTDPVVERVLRDLFAEADGPTIRVELAVGDREAVLGGEGAVSWTVDGEAQEPVRLAEVLFRAVGLLNRSALEADPARLHLHAGLVGHDERTVAIPGVRGAGKTTLASALLARGWSYGTDEMIAVHPDGTATALRKPLNCKAGSLERFEHVRDLRHPALEHWPADRAQLGVPPRWLPRGPRSITDVVVPVRSNRYRSPHLEPVTSAEAVRILAENSFDFERYGPLRSLEVAAKIAARARAWTLLHDDAVAAAALLDERLPAPEFESPQADPSIPEVVSIPALEHPASGAHVGQAPGTLGLAIDGNGVIWAPELDRVLQVSPPAFAAWASADGLTSPAERASLLSTTTAELGRVDDQLVQAGMLTPGDPSG